MSTAIPAAGVLSPRVHELKCWPEPFAAMKAGTKTAEFRLNDRGFKVGDVLRLMEFEQCVGLTGDFIERRITHILDAGFGMPEHYVMLSLAEAEVTRRLEGKAPVDERAEFEAWYPKTDRGYYPAKNRFGDGYSSGFVSSMWECWQARAALESSHPGAKPVALPTPLEAKAPAERFQSLDMGYCAKNNGCECAPEAMRGCVSWVSTASDASWQDGWRTGYAIGKGQSLRAPIAAAPPTPQPEPSAEDLLQELLARIHRDGGHYACAHGLAKAAADADQLVIALQVAYAASVDARLPAQAEPTSIMWTICRMALMVNPSEAMIHQVKRLAAASEGMAQQQFSVLALRAEQAQSKPHVIAGPASRLAWQGSYSCPKCGEAQSTPYEASEICSKCALATPPAAQAGVPFDPTPDPAMRMPGEWAQAEAPEPCPKCGYLQPPTD